MVGLNRRAALGMGAAGLLAGMRAPRAETIALPFANGERPMVKYPGKRPLIGLTSRPPQIETPFSVYGEGLITPNDAFFVRYHLADIPLSIDPDTFRLDVKGLVEHPLSLSLADLKAMPGAERSAPCWTAPASSPAPCRSSSTASMAPSPTPRRTSPKRSTSTTPATAR
jgi:sulfite dehydrogenase